MKKFKYTTIAFLLLMITAWGCKDEFTESYTANIPVYMSYEDLRSSVKYAPSQTLENPGKIYFKDNYIFINEMLKGVHIIDNSNPENPANIGFISIPGNVDIAIKEHTLYADSYIDLVVIDITDIQNPKEVGRKKEVFNYIIPPYDKNYPIAKVDKEKGVVTGWKLDKFEHEIEQMYYPVYHNKGWMEMNDGAFKGGNSPQGSTFGVGGSMARFGLYQKYLYTTENNRLTTFDISISEKPKKAGQIFLPGNAETLFVYDNHLFFGTQNGMLVYGLNSPILPNYKTMLRHITSCDPVVVDKNYAYVTLRGGTRCRSNINRLDVIELKNNYTQTTLTASYTMDNPYGLGIDDEILFVCDGDSGLKIYNTANKQKITDNVIAVFPNIHAYDVIPMGKYLFLIGKDGFYQYDYSDLNNIREVSKIEVNKKNQ